MNPVNQLVAFIASVSIIFYLLILAYYLRRIMTATEKLAGINQPKIVECSNCGRKINLGTHFHDPFTSCPICKSRIIIESPNIKIQDVRKEEKVLP